MEFISQNLRLVILAVTSGSFLLLTSLRGNASGQFSPAEAVQCINRENALVIDVRSHEEFSQGHLPGAIHWPPEKMADHQALLQKTKGKPVIAYCETGIRSNKAVAQLKASGLEKVFNLAGGRRAWLNAGFPTTRQDAAQ